MCEHIRPCFPGLAVIGSAATSFLLDLARLSIRTSNDDATKRMFAEALRTLILSGDEQGAER